MNINQKNNTARRWLSLSLCAALLLPLTSGSLHTAWAESGQSTAPQGERVVRIGSLWTGEEDTYFRQQFTDLYELQHPEVKLEIVPAIDMSELRFSGSSSQVSADNLENIRKIMGGDKPVDIIIGDSTLMKSLTEHNLVQPLQPLIDRDGYDISNMAPTVMDGIRELGDGTLYALAPTFNSSALYYNKGIFDAAGVSYPTNDMTWDEVLKLAAKVTKVSSKPDGRVYGFSMSRYTGDPFWDMQTYISPLQLAMYDNKGSSMTVNTPEWKKVWTTYSTLVKNQTVPGLDDTELLGAAENSTYSPVQGDLFLTGKAAMVIGEYGYVNELVDVGRNASKIPNYKSVKWGTVTVPTHTEQPGVAVGTWLGNMMAISATALHKEDAWDLIKFVNSNEVARIKAHNRYELTSRKDYITSREPGLDLQPFYTQKPLPAKDPVMEQLQIEKPGIIQVSDVGRQLFIEVYEGRQTVDRALRTWEKQGNTMLSTLKKDPTSTFNLEAGWMPQGGIKN